MFTGQYPFFPDSFQVNIHSFQILSRSISILSRFFPGQYPFFPDSSQVNIHSFHFFDRNVFNKKSKIENEIVDRRLRFKQMKIIDDLNVQ